AAHLVDVDERAGGVRRPGGQHALALGQAVGVVRRGVDVDHQLGPAVGLGGDGPAGVEGVLADGHADPHAGHLDERRGGLAGGEVALFVEDRVVGQVALVVDGVHPAPGADGGGVVEVAAGVDEPDDHGALAGRGRHPVERPPVVGDEAGLQQQVLGRVAGQRQLGEDGQVAARLLGLPGGAQHALDVAVEVADGRVDLAERDADAGHGPPGYGRVPTGTRRRRQTRPVELAELVDRSAHPDPVRAALGRLGRDGRVALAQRDADAGHGPPGYGRVPPGTRRRRQPRPVELAQLVDRRAHPDAVRAALGRLGDDVVARIEASRSLAEAFVTVVAASRSATRLIETDPAALDVLADLDDAQGGAAHGGLALLAEAPDGETLARAKRLAHLRIMAVDLLGRRSLEQTTAALSDVAATVL